MTQESSPTAKYWMALSSIIGLGPKTVRMLVSRFGSPGKVLSAPVIEIARMPRSDLRLAREIAGAKGKLARFENFIRQISEAGIDVLCPDSLEYPHLLKLTEDFPPILYKKGLRLPNDEISVAIVGTRFPTPAGAEAAERIAGRLAGMGIVVVSGLAKGVDTAAHRGALKSGGRSLAVLGSGLKMIYPRENSQLANDICVNGALLSECHPNEVVSGRRLIQRNRIISGISSAVILVEPKSGALNTAVWAARQGRRVISYAGSDSVPDDHMSGSVSYIHALDELDAVVEHLQVPENRDSQMYLL